MRVSLNTVKQFVKFELPPVDELVEKINQQLGAVEEIIDVGVKYQDAAIVRVVECEKLEGTDHLNVTKIDDGGAIDNVDRDENGLVQVVCGAPNVHADMLAVWLPPRATVPETFNDAEPFVLDTREIRGATSNGMLASPKELALGDSHDGILEISADEWKPNDVEIKPGASFAQAFGLDDTVIDIENKMFTHRPDLFGVLGVAREIAGILHEKFQSPDWYASLPTFEVGDGLKLSVRNDAPEKAPRFMAVAIKGVEVKPSPLWLQAELVRLGSKPINNIVDVTNYVMLLTAQPMHAYDYDKVTTGKLGVRLAGEGEKLKLLGGKEITLDSADIVITDGEKPIGLGGVMGGADTEVSDDTQNIILEVATFDMFTIRRTSMRHGLFTEASTRFTKGQSPMQNPFVLNLAMTSIYDVAGGRQSSAVIDLNQQEKSEMPNPKYGPDNLRVSFINQRLGLELYDDEIIKLLANVEFDDLFVKEHDKLSYWAPFWRTDLQIPEDVVEEVGRLYGFDKLPHDLPRRTLRPAPLNARLQFKSQLRDALSRAGANEVLTYSFVHRNLLEKAGQNADDTYQLSNALSPDLHYFRRTILPSLLDKVHQNVRSGYEHFAIFEIGKGHKKAAGQDEQGVPLEQEYVALALAGGDFYQAKSFTEFLAEKLGLRFEYAPVEQGKLFEPKRSALIKVGEEVVGAVGEYRSTIKRNFKLPDVASGFELDFDKLLTLAEDAASPYKPLSRFPSAERDVTLSVAADVSYADVYGAVKEALNDTDLETVVRPLGIYQPEDGDTKNFTFRIKLSSQEKTLTGDEITAVMEKLTSHAASNINATVV
jgi:phenylalanyl-tRNA synthetase beta chain